MHNGKYHCHMATNYHLLAAKQAPYREDYSRKILKNFLGEKSQENGPAGREKTRQKKRWE